MRIYSLRVLWLKEGGLRIPSSFKVGNLHRDLTTLGTYALMTFYYLSSNREEEVKRGILEFSDSPTPSSTLRGEPMVYNFLWLMSKTDLLELTFTEEEVKMLGVLSLSPSQLRESCKFT